MNYLDWFNEQVEENFRYFGGTLFVIFILGVILGAYS